MRDCESKSSVWANADVLEPSIRLGAALDRTTMAANRTVGHGYVLARPGTRTLERYPIII